MEFIGAAIFFLCILTPTYAQSSIGGTTAPDGEYPYHAAVRKNHRFLCGASIINEHWVLTAAHCTNQIQKVNECTVLVGTNSVKGVNGKEYTVAGIIIHERYNKDFIHSNDIALIRVAETIQFNDKVLPVNLPRDGSKKYDGTSAILTGWGVSYNESAPSKDLQHVKVYVINNSKCEKKWKQSRNRKIDTSQICTSGKIEDNLVTSGDSGGPLVTDGVQIGIVSFAWDGLPDVFTRVTSFMPWITSRTGIE